MSLSVDRSNFPSSQEVFNLPQFLHGRYLSLRPLIEADFERLFLAASDPAIWAHHPESNRFQRNVFQEYFNGALKCNRAFIILDAMSSRVLGSSRYYDYSQESKSVKIGFTFLIKECWGGPFNKELKHLMLMHAFKFVETVYFDVASNNEISQKALRNIGAEYVESRLCETRSGQMTKILFRIRRGDFKGLL